MKKILYLPIETIAREFDARMLLAHMAVNRGYTVIIGEKSSVYRSAQILGSGIYFHKSHGSQYFPVDKKTDNKTRNKVLKFISLDEEGLVFINDDNFIRDSKPFELNHLDILFTWGSYQRDLLVKANPELAPKTIPVGNPRFDLLRKEFFPLYKKEVDKILKKWGRYILINTRFVPGNFSRLYGCKYFDYRVHQFETVIGRDMSEKEKDFFIREEKYYIKVFRQYKEMMETLASRFPDINFILRPHPSEDVLRWKEALKGYPNVSVVFEGSAIEWIYGATAVIHSGCTTGIEAWALRKPVIVYNLNYEEDLEPALPNEFGIKIDDIEVLCDRIKNIIDGGFELEANDGQLKMAHSFIESIDGNYSAAMFLNSLDNLYSSDVCKAELFSKDDVIKVSSMRSLKKVFKIKILKFMSRYQTQIRNIFGGKITDIIYRYFKKYPGLFAQFKKFPELKSKKIKNLLQIYDDIFHMEHNVVYRIQKISEDTFLLSKNSNI
jgi:surface carbohydrate biosynthesis protein